jgi:hypothetical protein
MISDKYINKQYIQCYSILCIANQIIAWSSLSTMAAYSSPPHHFPFSLFYFPFSAKSFRINTCKSLSKQTALTAIMHLTQKGVQVWKSRRTRQPCYHAREMKVEKRKFDHALTKMLRAKPASQEDQDSGPARP